MSNKKKLELKIYEFLGVKQFKKAVFMLEKIIHKRDKEKILITILKIAMIENLLIVLKNIYIIMVLYIRKI